METSSERSLARSSSPIPIVSNLAWCERIAPWLLAGACNFPTAWVSSQTSSLLWPNGGPEEHRQRGAQWSLALILAIRQTRASVGHAKT